MQNGSKVSQFILKKNPPNQIGSLPEKNPHLFYEMCYIMTM